MITIRDILFWGTLGILIFLGIWLLDVILLMCIADL